MNKDEFKKVAKIYSRFASPWKKLIWEDILCSQGGGLNLLDAGGGFGRITNRLIDCFESIFIFDYSLPMLRRASTINKGVDRICGTVDWLPFPENSIDAIIVVDAFHHFPNQKNALGSLLQVLKPGGIFILEDPDIRKFSVKLLALAEKFIFKYTKFLRSEVIANWIDPEKFTIDIMEDRANYILIIKKRFQKYL